MARLIHGASVCKENFSHNNINTGLICALMHDTGFIQLKNDNKGTGAKYTGAHIERSKKFVRKYFRNKRKSGINTDECCSILQYAGFFTNRNEIHFSSSNIKLLGEMLGTADLYGQMADRAYLEKLVHLYYEFKEANIPGFESEFEFLKKTIDFYKITNKMLKGEFGNVKKYMRYHFKARWNINKDLYYPSIENQIKYLKNIIRKKKDHREKLRRAKLPKLVMS